MSTPSTPEVLSPKDTEASGFADEEQSLPVKSDALVCKAPATSSSFSAFPRFSQGSCDVTKKRPVVIVEFLDGYAFRQLCEFFKATLTSAPMYFTESGITVLRSNGDNSLIVHLQFKAYQLVSYYFDPTLANIPATKTSAATHVINCNVSKFRDSIKSAARKEWVRITQYEGDMNIKVEIHGGNKNGQGETTVPFETFDQIFYDLNVGFKQPINSPNCKIPLSEFCNACSVIGKSKGTSYANLVCFPNGCRIEFSPEPGSAQKYQKWGNCDEKIETVWVPGGHRLLIQCSARQGSKSNTVRIPIETVKALGKLGNLVNNGILGIYCENNRMARLLVGVNYYAELALYLIDAKNKESA